jgi:lambda family phage portal protein
MATAEQRSDLFQRAVDSILQVLPQTLPRGRGAGRLVAADGSPLIPHQTNQYQRAAAQNKGSLRTWRPRRLSGDEAFNRERETIVDRVSDLINSDAHAAGAVETAATLIVGTGLNPYPTLNSKLLKIEKTQQRDLQEQMRQIWRRWSPWADAGRRLSIGGIQFQVLRDFMHFGEFFALVHMINDPVRPYALAVRLIDPTRCFTPTDLINRKDIKDGVEIGAYGEPVAYWIQRAGGNGVGGLTSANFARIDARRGHRFKILHGFYMTDDEQVRGVSILSPAVKLFRDLADYVDAELVSNVVTAAFALFIETASADPYQTAYNFATITDTKYKSDQSSYDQRYQEVIPGAVMYGSGGQKPHIISAQRPSVTFEPFVRLILKAIAVAAGIPYPVLFRDFKEMNYASYRSAMLEAWRVVRARRGWMADGFCGPLYRMLIEEAYLRNEIEFADFYGSIYDLTDAQWIGPPKGQIEPEKEVKADILAIQHNLKSREEVLLEQSRDIRATLDQLAEEQEMMDERGLNELAVGEVVEPGLATDQNKDEQAEQNEGGGDDAEDN